MNKTYVIIGHRGTGKSSWAKGLKSFFEDQNESVLLLDLDQEIENQSQQKISVLLLKGEDFFRQKENQIAKEVFKKAQNFNGLSLISVGAGFCGDLPRFFQVIHLQRPSDSCGRIFLDRPRLLKKMDPLEESIQLYLKRKSVYQKQRDFILSRVEHFQSIELWDEVFFQKKPLPFQNGILTLNPQQIPSSQEKMSLFFDQKLSWNLKYFEMRDDQVSPKFLKDVLKYIPHQKILLSFRKKNAALFHQHLSLFFQKPRIDWPMEWGENHSLNPDIYSLHKRKSCIPLRCQLKSYSKKSKNHLKLAIPIFSFEELLYGHHWWKKNPNKRSFHPRSRDGRWKWYRLLFNPHQPLYFIGEDNEEDVLDRPLMAESVCFNVHNRNGFACVLGDPVDHSATPYEMKSFFKKHHLSVVAIRMTEKEMSKKNLKILQDLGMRFAAVTSPLKKKLYQICRSFSSDFNLGQKIKSPSLNTLILTKKGWRGFSTDPKGAQFLSRYIQDPNKVVVWGGGGIREILKEQFQEATFYSARTGQILEGKNKNPEIVIWAVGSSRMPACRYPPPHWSPQLILDVNYSEDSPGRRYALLTKAKYISGHGWFKAQAELQKKLFDQNHGIL